MDTDWAGGIEMFWIWEFGVARIGLEKVYLYWQWSAIGMYLD